MPNPWLLALRVIPWATLLRNGPAIAKAADALLSSTKTQKQHLAATADQFRSLNDRIAALELHDREDAELVKQMSDQVQALTTVSEVLAVRVRWLAITVAVLSVALLTIVLMRL